MIVNARQDGWEIIYQRSHANLAAILVSLWGKSHHVPRWTELIIATAQHDDQEMFWNDSQHLTEVGAPMDFTLAELNTSQLQAQLVIDNAYRQGVWIALLISKHNSFLYEPLRGQDAQLDTFLDRQRHDQKAWTKQLGYPKKDVDKAYAFLRWADRLSLILCWRELPERERALDVECGPDGKMIQVMQRADGTVTLRPWVFEETHVTVSVEARHLKQLKFETEDEFRQSLEHAEIETREWSFAK